MSRLRDRATGDLLVLMIAGTVCFSVLAAGGACVVALIIDPDANVVPVVSRVTGVINTLIGLLAGFLAGRTNLTKKPGDE
jgi:protein-S-isoprenylcysteine O-methyltransferase Ste14